MGIARVDEFSTNAMAGAPVVQNASTTPATFTVGKSMTPTIFAGVLQDGVGGGALRLTVQGPLTLSGNNLHTGLTSVHGILTLENVNALGSAAGGTTLRDNGIIDLRGLAIVGETLTVEIGALRNTSVTPASWTGDITSTNSLRGLTILGSGDVLLSGSVSPSAIDRIVLTKSDPNTLELTGTTDNSGLALRAAEGVVRLAKTSSASVRAVGGDVLIEGGTVQLAGTGGNQLGANVSLTSGSFDTNGRNETIGALTLNGFGIGAAGALVNSASGDSVLTTSSGGISIETFTRIGVTQSGASLTLAASLSGSGFQKVGLGTLILSRAGDFPDVLLTAGTIAIGINTALGTSDLVFEGGALRARGGRAPSPT